MMWKDKARRKNYLVEKLKAYLVDNIRIASLELELADISERALVLQGQLVARMHGRAEITDLSEIEFRVFSQFGEDGIIQYLIRRTGISLPQASFVEFGVGDYSEANTRFLLINDNWRGLIMDASGPNMAAVRNWPLYWKYDLAAKQAFIDRDNIDDLIASAGFSGEIGLLSIDIDGNDYWVRDRISAVAPIIVIVEYNGLFGASRAVTVPYDPAFDRGRAHYSHLYWGSSLKALELLANRKGYALVGCNNGGNNAFFDKGGHLNGQPKLTTAQAYKECRVRDSRDRAGHLNTLSGQPRIDEIAGMPLLDIETNGTVKVGDLIQRDSVGA
jgi:hypothetical protein